MKFARDRRQKIANTSLITMYRRRLRKMNARLISQAKTIRKLKAECCRLQKQIQKVEARHKELQERHLALEAQLKEKNCLLAAQNEELRELLAKLEQLQKEGEISEEQAAWMIQIRNRLLSSTDDQ